MVIETLAHSGGQPSGLIVGAVLVVLTAPFFIRAGIYVTTAELRCIPISGKETRLAWSTIVALRVREARIQGQFGYEVYAELTEERLASIPLTQTYSKFKAERLAMALSSARAGEPSQTGFQSMDRRARWRAELADDDTRLFLGTIAAVLVLVTIALLAS